MPARRGTSGTKRSGSAAGRSPEMRRRFLLAGILVSAVVALGRAFQLAVIDGREWRAAAVAQQGDTLTLPPARGTIYDRDRMPLASTAEVYSFQLAPREIADPDRVVELLTEHLDITRRRATQLVNSSKRWIVLPGRHGVRVREALDGVAGIHYETVLQRFYPNGELARELLGPVSTTGEALGGIESEFDSILNGRSGLAIVRQDARGRPLPGSMLRAVEPTPGRDLILTIDYDLQEIAAHALDEALDSTGASSGELLLTDPHTGEILAAVSRARTGRARTWRAVTDPYEPGSILKPFTVAALMSLDRAALTDSVYGEEGRDARLRLTDVHAMGWMNMAEALRESSNIGIAKLAERMSRAEQYTELRDFGFGTPTGIPFPSEAAGLLRRPQQWTRYSASRLAIGYEVNVTPLQMAMAYGALANGGLLLEPRLVREVRSRDGRMERSYSPRVVRRVISEEISTALRGVLADAVQDGTGTAASMGPFEVAGKTGTVRRTENGRYKAGAYTASFAGFFPARDPQMVFVVKLDDPQGQYYGGAVAAPVTRATLESALAAHQTPLDRGAIAKTPQLATEPVLAPVQRSPVSEVVLLSERRQREAEREAGEAPLPDVTGMPLRDGVRRLHEAGFRLRVEGSGRVIRTLPAAGELTPHDAVVRVVGEAST